MIDRLSNSPHAYRHCRRSRGSGAAASPRSTLCAGVDGLGAERLAFEFGRYPSSACRFAPEENGV